MVGNFGVETDVLKMLGDNLWFQYTETKTFTTGLMIVEFLNELLVAPL